MKLWKLLEVYPPQPRATMPLGIRVNDVVYAGNITGADPVTGAISSDLEIQLVTALNLLRHAIERAGGRLPDVRRVSAAVADASDGELIELALSDSLRGASVEIEPGPMPQGILLRLDAIAALTPGADKEVVELRIGSTPAGVLVGDILFSAGVTATDRETGVFAAPDTQSQLHAAFENLERLLDAAGTDGGSVLRVGGYLRDLGEKDLLNAEMVRRFPDARQKPVHKYVPAALPDGLAVSLQVIARLGVQREIIEIPGIVHNDPISLGARAGNLLVSSRVQGRLAESAIEQAERLIESHARTLLQHLGGDLRHVTQTTWGIGEATFAADIERVMQRYWPDGGPDLQIVEAGFSHSPLPRLEFIALIDE